MVIYETAFDELSDWLIGILNTENRFDNLLHFETLSDKEGTYVSFNSLSTYIKLSVSKAKDVPYSVLENITSGIISTDNRDSECLFSAIRIMRKFISIGHRALKTLGDKTEKLVSFTCDDFWTCAPLLLRNFIGSVTLNNDDFQKIQRHYDFYNIFMQDMFEKSSNWLKICSITYDILNCKNDQFISPKHYMLANELLQHERSADLVSIFNRYGHTCSYQTIVKLHQEVAKKEGDGYQLPTSVRPGYF
ncbi:unnamed protein product, partial [Didymodactylos carnosus]